MFWLVGGGGAINGGARAFKGYHDFRSLGAMEKLVVYKSKKLSSIQKYFLQYFYAALKVRIYEDGFNRWK